MRVRRTCEQKVDDLLPKIYAPVLVSEHKDFTCMVCGRKLLGKSKGRIRYKTKLSLNETGAMTYKVCSTTCANMMGRK